MSDVSPEVAKELKKLGGEGSGTPPRTCCKIKKAWENPKFKAWIAGLFICFVIAFIEPFLYAMENAATLAMWVNVFSSGEVLFLAVSSMITALNDSVHSIKDFPAIEVSTLVVGAVLYGIIKVVALKSNSFNMGLAIVVTLMIWVVVLTRCISMYLINGEDGK